MTDYDPRIVDLYDGDNPDGPDHDYFRSLAEGTDIRSVLDVGCGTGILTVTLAAPERTVVGVDPSHAMINYARNRPGAERVTWIEGDTRSVPGSGFDLIVMTGNVAQHIPDPAWERTLGDLRELARKGATLAFESRNPAARAWDGWHRPEPTVRDTQHGPLREWCEVAELERNRVLLRFHNHFESSDELVVEESELAFRDRDLLTDQLRRAGFGVSAVRGDWHRTPFDGSQPIMVFEAHAV
ncbi:class I SAM-dependent methyltransferase [Kocuria marina]|uniref:class I SAM-dependent methyltransferase n=1 Tax=Kocuria marina TaxID=223184 RepID=UPI003F21701E